MQFSNLSALSLSELKALAISNNAIPTGDKRFKQSWIDAIELSQRQAALDVVEPTDEEFEEALSERECLGEFSQSEIDAWTDEETVSDAEMEAIAHVADTKAAELGDSVTPTVPASTKKGAATVFSALLCILILAIQSVLCIGCVIVQAATHLKNLFGSYNPDYDLFGQLYDMVRKRKSIVPTQQTQQPAY